MGSGRGGVSYEQQNMDPSYAKTQFDGGDMPRPGASTGIRLGGSFRPQAVFHDLIVNVLRQLQSLHFNLLYLKTENDRL